MQMHNKLFRQAYGLACLAVFAMIALVACGSGPGAKAQPEPAQIPEQSLVKGGIIRFSLANAFSAPEGEELTYTATSSNKAVATVSVDKDVLTITAVGAGPATITVIAKDSQNRTSTPQIFTVTVPEPEEEEEEQEEQEEEEEDEEEEEEQEEDEEETTTTNNPTTCTSSLTILTIELNEIAKCKIASKATLKAPPPPPGADPVAGVEARPSADADETDVWIIAARKKGTYTVTIFSGAASPEKIGAIRVIVPNSRPVRNTEKDPAGAITASLSTTGPYSVTLSPALGEYFDDDDTADENMLRYSIGKKPPWLLIDAEDGFAITETGLGDDTATRFTSGSTLTFEVLEKVTEDFQVTIYASDDSGDKSLQPVVLKFGLTDADGAPLIPSSRNYPVQQKATGELNEKGTLKVGPRRGVPHTVTFNVPTGKTGFVFAESASDKLIAEKKLGNFTVTTATAAVHFLGQDGTYTPPLPNESVANSEGTDYFVIKSTGAVVLDGSTATLTSTVDVGSTVTFQLKTGSSGSITIHYYVWALNRAPRTDNERMADHVDRVAIGTTSKPYSKTLSISVVTCSSPPDPIDACPGVDL